MAVIDCNNRPEFTLKETRGSGYIYSAQFTEASSLADLTTAYNTNALDETVPATSAGVVSFIYAVGVC